MFEPDSRFLKATPQDDGTLKVVVKPRYADAFYRNHLGQEYLEFTITNSDLLALSGIVK